MLHIWRPLLITQGYPSRPAARDDTVHTPAEPAEPAEPAPASKQSGDERKDEQPGECALRETQGTASHINASKTPLPTHRPALRSHIGHQPEENGTEVADLLNELDDLVEEQNHISSKVDNVVSRLRKALEPTQGRSRRGGKFVRWADSAGVQGRDDDTSRPKKRARRGL
jgi:hypothetical protein